MFGFSPADPNPGGTVFGVPTGDLTRGIGDLAGKFLGARFGKPTGNQQKVTVSQSQASEIAIGFNPQIFVQAGDPSLGSPNSGVGGTRGGGASAPSAATANDTQPRLSNPSNQFGRASISTPFAIGAGAGLANPLPGEGILASFTSSPILIAVLVAGGAFVLLKGKK